MPYISKDKHLEHSIENLECHDRVRDIVTLQLEDNISRIRAEMNSMKAEKNRLCKQFSKQNKNAHSEIKSKIESKEIKPLASAMKKLVLKILKALSDYDRVSEVIDEIIRQESFKYYLAMSKRKIKKEKLCKK